MDILIRPATAHDSQMIAGIGRIAVDESHRSSCSDADMAYFLDTHYSEAAIMNELTDPANIYHIIFYEEQPAGFSKIIPDVAHPNIPDEHVTKLDRIYLLSDFYDQKLGYHLLQHNIALSKKSGQSGMWLFTWVDNARAVNFYKRNGFSIIGDHKFKVSDTHYNAHHQMFLKFET